MWYAQEKNFGLFFAGFAGPAKPGLFSNLKPGLKPPPTTCFALPFLLVLFINVTYSKLNPLNARVVIL